MRVFMAVGRALCSYSVVRQADISKRCRGCGFIQPLGTGWLYILRAAARGTAGVAGDLVAGVGH